VHHAEGVVDVEPVLLEHVELVISERYVHGDHATTLLRQAHDGNTRCKTFPAVLDEDRVAGNVMRAQASEIVDLGINGIHEVRGSIPLISTR